MGAGASVKLEGLPEYLTAAEAKDFCGVFYDQSKFEQYKGLDDSIRKSDLISMVRNFENEALREKFSAVSPHERDLWDPLIKSYYYRKIIASALPEYSAADKEGKRRLLLQSFANLDVCALCCECCGIPFKRGILCRRERTTIFCGPGDAKKVWDNFDDADPDDIAIHLWTYSMGGKESFYRKVNTALLNESGELLKELCYIICGVVSWINTHAPTHTQDITLYRGTPIAESQEHSVGDALHPRMALAEFIDPADTAAIRAAEQSAKQAHELAKNICRMPMFLATSESLAKAQEFTWIRSNGIACPILEFCLPPNCDGVAHVEPLSHFPEEREYLLTAYTPVEYKSQRLEYLEVGYSNPTIKLVMIVSYQILASSATFEKFESTGQDLKSALIMCKPTKLAFELNQVSEMMMDDKVKEYAYEDAGVAVSYVEQRRVRMEHQQQEEELLEECEMLVMEKPGVDALAHNLQLADDTNDENLMKIAIEEFVLLYSHNDPDSILTAFLLYRNTEQFVKMKNRLVYAKQEIPNAKTQRDCAENIVSDCIVRLEELDMQILNLENALRTLLLNITSEKGALREMKVQLAICKTEKSRLLKEVEKMRIDAKSATAALRTWCRQLAALHAEERKAYGRFWERHGSSSVDDRKRLECDLQAAGNEYIESVFPRMEMERLENDLKTLEKGIEDCNNQIDSCVMAIAVKEVDIKTQKDLLESMQVNKQQLDYDVEHSKSALEIIEVKKIKAEKEVEERAHRIKELEYIIRITPAAIFAAIKGDFVKPCIENAVAPVSTEQLKSDLKVLEADRQKCKSQLQTHEEAIFNNKNKIMSQEQMIKSMEESILKVKRDLDISKSQLKNVESLKSSTENEMNTFTTRIEMLESIIDKIIK